MQEEMLPIFVNSKSSLIQRLQDDEDCSTESNSLFSEHKTMDKCQTLSDVESDISRLDRKAVQQKVRNSITSTVKAEPYIFDEVVLSI